MLNSGSQCQVLMRNEQTLTAEPGKRFNRVLSIVVFPGIPQ